VAYTPSRGVISMRGNWPLVPTMDVVVPHTRSMQDLFEILDIIVAADPEPRGDFWRMQKWLAIPAATAHRPAHYRSLADGAALRGRRLGVPRMYINADPQAETWEPVRTRDAVIAQWRQARAALESLGAEVVEVDFPAVSEYERDGVGGAALARTGVVPRDFSRAELWDLAMFAWDDFLAANGDPHLHALADVDGPLIFPRPTGAQPDPSHERDLTITLADYPRLARERGITPLERIPDLAEGIRGLEEFRRRHFDAWLDDQGLDALVFPTVADIAPADADTNPVSAAIAWRNGIWVANGNLVIRHLGIPTVSVPMGILSDIGMPIGLTFAAKPYEDAKLLGYAYAFEQSGAWRAPPVRTPALPTDFFPSRESVAPVRRSGPPPELSLRATIAQRSGDAAEIRVEGETTAARLALFVNGEAAAVRRDGGRFTACRPARTKEHRPRHSEWREPYGHIVLAVASGDAAPPVARYVVVDGTA
jgi:amidase